jgi:hypothetical protein
MVMMINRSIIAENGEKDGEVSGIQGRIQEEVSAVEEESKNGS